ncbi:phosphoribosylglycinamide formyltransferase [Thiolapillus sp.]
MPRLPVVVLISGGGTNLQAIIDAAQKDLPVEIKAVISNKPGAYGLERARKAGIAVATLDHRQFPDRESFDQALAERIDGYQPRLVLLAGFMRILTPGFVRRYHGRMLNIHPSLLPDFQGLHTHQRALDAEVEEHGASIHFVTEELDGGPVIIQARVPVLSGDNAQTLAARVLEKEHIIYPLAVRWFAQGRLSLNDRDQVVLDGKIRSTPVQLEQVAID